MPTYYVESLEQFGNYHPAGYEPCTFTSRRAAQAHAAEHRAGLFQRMGGHVEMGRMETTERGASYRHPLYRYTEGQAGGYRTPLAELADEATMRRLVADADMEEREMAARQYAMEQAAIAADDADAMEALAQ